ncbi:hypothetical protein GCM10007908_03490 [Rhizobium albus]|nr:hypothetical protein GCM10007908_03490 [Rhizobium albus]
MNEFRAFAHPVHGGFHAMIRLAHQAKPEPVKGRGGAPILYATELDAHKAATAHLEAYFNGSLTRDGDTLSTAKREADVVFAKFTKQRGKEKRIEVVRRRVGA